MLQGGDIASNNNVLVVKCLVIVLAMYPSRTLKCKEAVNVQHIVHLVLSAGEDSPKCGVYSIGIRLVQFEGSVDVAFIVAISVGIHGGITFRIADF